MSELPAMLQELIEMLDDEEIDACWHPDPAQNQERFCDQCFINNMRHVSFDEPWFTEETSPKQRETIEKLWNRYCNDESWEENEE